MEDSYIFGTRFLESSMETKKPKQTMETENICKCGCHVKGRTVMHIVNCCESAYKKYINSDGSIDKILLGQSNRPGLSSSMETVKPLTWEVKSSTHSIGETGDYETVVWLQKGMLQLIANDDDAEEELKEVAELLNDASSRVREVEETNAKLTGIVTHFEHEMELTKSLLEASEQENKRLQERLEAADNWFETLSDYKAALRVELERLADPQNYNGAHDFDDGMIYAYKQAIELLDTVTPKEK